MTHAARRVLRITGTVVAAALAWAALATAVLTLLIPKLAGGASLIVLSGSMEPTFSPGDVIAAQPVATNSLRTGDIVTVQPRSADPTLFTHRIVEIRHTDGATWITTRGDANNIDDEPVLAEQVRGRMMYRVPLVGWVAITAGNQRGPIVIGAATLLIGYGAFELVRRRGNRKENA